MAWDCSLLPQIKSQCVLILSSQIEASTMGKTEMSHICILPARLALIFSWLLVGKLVGVNALHRSSLQQLTTQLATSAPRLFNSSRSVVHLLAIAWQSRLSIAQSFHSAVSVTFLVVTFITCACNVKQESNSPYFEHFFSRGFLPGSFETNSGSNSKHFFGDVIDVGRILRVLDFGRFGVGTGWLQWSEEQHCGRQSGSTSRPGRSLHNWSFISLHGWEE